MQPVLRKLSLFAEFSPEEAAAIELAFTQIIDVREDTEITREDDPPDSVHFLLEGFICRQKLLPDGSRQILAFVLPGDPCDVGVSVLDRLDHTLVAMTDCRLARISDAALQHLMSQYPKIRAAMQWAAMQRDGILQEWIVNVGQRQAVRRLAHLFCEVYKLSAAVGLTNGQSCMLPLTQTDLGDAVGLSAVHVNRTLQDLRAKGLFAFGDKRLTILDLPGLERVAEMDDTYLHLEARYEPERWQNSARPT